MVVSALRRVSISLGGHGRLIQGDRPPRQHADVFTELSDYLRKFFVDLRRMSCYLVRATN